MAQDHTPHQRRIIQGFYRNRDALDQQRLEELVGEIWLARGERALDRLWARAAELLARTPGVAADEAERIVAARDVEALAAVAGRDPGPA